MSTTTSVSRRSLIGAGLGLSSAAMVGCRSDGPGPGGHGSPGPSAGAPSQDIRPAYIPYDGPAPELPGDGAAGVPNGFLSYPDPAPSTGTLPLGLSEPVEFMVQGIPSPTLRERNKWWQQFEADLGTEISINSTDSTQYTARFQTAVAGNNLAEVTQIVRVPQLPQLLEKAFTDLTPYLSGDNIAKYPNLANTPSAAWDMCTINGKIWGLTNPRIIAGTLMMTRGDLLQEKGIAAMPDLSNGEDFLDMCRELTDRSSGVFAIGQIPQNWTLPLILESLGGPNGWRVEDGQWTSMFEAPEFAQALEIVTGMWAEGLFHPNTYTDLSSSGVWWRGGATTLFAQNFAAWSTYVNGPDFSAGAIVMPKWDGGGVAAKHLGVPGYDAPVGLAKTDDENRIHELLRVADYIASPFGTEEYLKIKYGVRDHQYRMVDGQVEVIPDVSDERFVPTYFGALTAVDLYVPGQDDSTRQLHSYCQAMIPTGIANPQYGRFSDTALTDGAAADRDLYDLMGEIIQGRKSMTDWDPGVAEWRTRAGDAMAREYAESE